MKLVNLYIIKLWDTFFYYFKEKMELIKDNKNEQAQDERNVFETIK